MFRCTLLFVRHPISLELWSHFLCASDLEWEFIRLAHFNCYERLVLFTAGTFCPRHFLPPALFAPGALCPWLPGALLGLFTSFAHFASSYIYTGWPRDRFTLLNLNNFSSFQAVDMIVADSETRVFGKFLGVLHLEIAPQMAEIFKLIEKSSILTCV